jgi:early secretory antigenic target protein ESAT-6
MSGDGQIVVTFGAVNEAAVDTDGVASQIAAQLSDLKAFLAPLAGSWSGGAAGEFQALQAKWDASAGDLNQVLRQMSQALRAAAEQYQATEKTNSSVWS